ncbi:MAG TPA: hypothetical protein VGX50_09315, partial [Longimicrobium sp.]|nr:hypothetical protein [Longimicrobium sp.]
FLQQGGEWARILAFLYIVAAVFRLARFNIEQAGTAKSTFHGLPSPTAGSCLATYYAFTQTPFFDRFLDRVPVTPTAGWLTLFMGLMMVSNVLYPVVPRFSTRTWSGRFAIILAVASLVSAFTYPEYFFFPFSILYITYGLVRSVGMGLAERLPERDFLEDELDPDERRELDYEDMRPRRFGRRRVDRMQRNRRPSDRGERR